MRAWSRRDACLRAESRPAAARFGAPWAATLLLAAAAAVPAAKWGVPPQGWNDFRFALADDNTHADVIGQALQANTKIYGRYRYLNGGVDTAANWYSYSGAHGVTVLNFDASSQNLGISSSFVIYMLQEDGGWDAFHRNVNDATFMKRFFWNLEWVAATMKGQGTVYVIEPDTWGYLLQEEHRRGAQNPGDFGKLMAKETALVNNVGYDYLQDLPNTVPGLMQAILRVFRHIAPDARVGFHANTWAWYPATGGDINGMVYWPQSAIDTYADIVSGFFNTLLGSGDRGDFLVVEKYGLDAGVGGQKYYWNDQQNAKWVGWAKRVAQGMDLPVIGWQIPIGHMGLPNTPNRYEDTFMPYFFAHPKDFTDAGFVGMWVGKGLANGTDYSTTVGEGDDGWLFEHMRAFDAGRPYLSPLASRPVRMRPWARETPVLRIVRGTPVLAPEGWDGPAFTPLGRRIFPAAQSPKDQFSW